MAAESPLQIVVDPVEALAETLAERIESESRRALAERGRFTIALSGGSVAERFFPRLARVPLDADRTHLFWADERAVAPDDPESNFALAERLWLRPAGVPAERIHRMPAEAPDLRRAAADYDRKLRELAGDPPRLDLVLLGVGADGHVASVFPGSTASGDGAAVLAVEDSPKPPPRRLTLSLPTLAAAALVVVSAFGGEKKAAIRAALTDAGSMLPVARLCREAPRVLLLLDVGAAPGSPAASVLAASFNRSA